MQNYKILKKASIFSVFILLLIPNFFSTAQTTVDESIDTTQNNNLGTFGIENGGEVILDESFNTSTFPPDWTRHTTNPSATWHIEYDEYLSHSPDYCAVCYNNIHLQDEWLITPRLDFKNYSEVKLSFFWMTDYWIATYADKCDLNVSISDNGGITWNESLWCEDKYVNPYDCWNWNDTDLGKHIDITKYNYSDNVKIRFQYFSEEGINGCQMWLDDILVYGYNPEDPDKLNCTAGGPYVGEQYISVSFEGSATGGNWPYLFRWDFGDNSSYDYRQNPNHRFDEYGIFNVTLRVTDLSIPRKFDIDYTTANISKRPDEPSRLNIQNITGGLGIKAEIKNKGGDNLTDIEWEIYVRGGPLGFNIFDKLKNGTIDNLAPGEIKVIQLKYYFGFGIMHLKITAVSHDIKATTREKLIWKYGLLTKVFK